MYVPGLGTPLSHVHASSVSWTLVMVSRETWRLFRLKVATRSIGESTTSSCVWSSSNVTMSLVCQRCTASCLEVAHRNATIRCGLTTLLRIPLVTFEDMFYTCRMTHSASDLDQHRGLLEAWVEKRRQIAVLEAEASALLADRVKVHDTVVYDHPHHREAIHRSMIAEYSAAGRMSKGSVEYAFADACFLDADHPAVRDAFGRGAITVTHMREIIRAGMPVRQAVRDGKAAAETLGLYDTAALVVAEQESPARTAAMVRQIASALAGETVVERHQRARGERSVTVRSIDDGLALLQVVLPEHLAHAILDRLTRLGQQLIAARAGHRPGLDSDHRPGLDSGLRPGLDSGLESVFFQDTAPDNPLRDDPAHERHPHVIFGTDSTFATDPSCDVDSIPSDERGIDAIRADLLSDLLLVSQPSTATGSEFEGIHARIQVTVAASTLLGADDRPAELDGFGPLHPDIARDLAGGNGGWSRLFLDHTGMVTATSAYTPTASMRRHLRARDQHCRFPGCRMPVHRCQIDHNHDHAKGGRTSIDNLSHFCTGHHALKHPAIAEQHRWRARQLGGGDIEWTSPLGRTYTDASPRRVMFL